VETKDALLHAIHEQYVEAVEALLDYEETIHVEGELWVGALLRMLLYDATCHYQVALIILITPPRTRAG
jgi:hypothetical protein